MPCAVVCIPEGHQEKCAGQLNLLKKKNPGLKWAVTDKPLDAVSKANEMAEAESGKLCSLFIVHSKFFNITKDPFAATLFKTAQKGPTATFGCGKESGCDKPGKKFHWYMGPDGEWDVAAATKNINKLLDGQFTENGFHGKPLRKAPPSSEISAMGGTGGRSLAPAMSMGNGMGMMGSMGMGGGMGGMNGNMNGGGMGMSGSLSSGNLTGNSFGASGGMNGTMGGMSGQMGGMASPGGMRGSIGAQGGMGGGGMMTAAGDSGMGSMGAMGNTGMGGGAMGGMSGGGMNMAGGAMGGMSGGGLGMPGGGMNMSGGAMGGMSGGTMGGMSGGGMGMSGGGMGLGAAAPAPPVDVVSEAESMLSKGLPVSDVVKMLASEVKRLKVIVEGK